MAWLGERKEVQQGSEQHHRLIMVGLLLGIALAALDSTIVGTSLYTVARELSTNSSSVAGVASVTAVVSAYLLSSTVVIPLAGKMSDRTGRRPVFLAGMGVFLGGSVLCGVAQNIDQLIAFRFVQGLGGGMIFPVAFATVADLYPPSERGKIQGALSGVFGIAFIIGPSLGGYIVDHLSWRWIFYVNVPVGLAAIAITFRHFPRAVSRSAKPLDLPGAVTLTTALSAVVLLAIWGGSSYAWDSAVILGLAALCILCSIAFVAFERRAADPLVPLDLFKNRVFSLSNVATMLLGGALFSVVVYYPILMQGVLGVTASASGELLTPLMLMVVIGAAVSGRLLAKTGYKVWIVTGPLMAAIGFVLLATVGPSTSQAQAVGVSLIVGLGMGFTMATFVVAVQNVVERRHIGSSTSTLTLFRSLGGTVGISALGVLLRQRMAEEIPKHVPPEALGTLQGQAQGGAGFGGALPGSLPPAVLQGIREALAASLGAVFLGAAALCFAALAVTVFIKNVPLKTKEEYLSTAAAEGGISFAEPVPAAQPAEQPPHAPARASFAAAPAVPALPAPSVPERWIAPRIAEVRHDPPLPLPGMAVETRARLVPDGGSAGSARVELRVGGALMAHAETRVPSEGADVRLRWFAPNLARDTHDSLVIEVLPPTEPRAKPAD